MLILNTVYNYLFLELIVFVLICYYIHSTQRLFHIELLWKIRKDKMFNRVKFRIEILNMSEQNIVALKVFFSMASVTCAAYAFWKTSFVFESFCRWKFTIIHLPNDFVFLLLIQGIILHVQFEAKGLNSISGNLSGRNIAICKYR